MSYLDDSLSITNATVSAVFASARQISQRPLPKSKLIVSKLNYNNVSARSSFAFQIYKQS